MNCTLNVKYKEKDIIELIKRIFSPESDSNLDFKDDLHPVSMHRTPFTCCVMPNAIDNQEFIVGLKKELLGLKMFEKNNDLYKFQQSDDLKNESGPFINAFKQFMYGPMLDWMKAATGIELNDKVDLTCSQYKYTDILLCHDDELEGRRIAFILYLVDDWNEEDGGALDLFDRDDHGLPHNVVRSLLPASGQFSWFEVTEKSHHQVAEVLSKDKVRLSVNGWFHGPPIPRPERYVEPVLKLSSFQDIDEDVFYAWINPLYLNADTQAEIQSEFEENSEIELADFFREEKYRELGECLKNSSVKWISKGPPNKRLYNELLDDESTPTIIKECIAVMKSEPWFLTLANLTGLSLHPMFVKETESKCDTTGMGSNDSSSNGKQSDLSEPVQKRRKSDGELHPGEIHSEDKGNDKTSGCCVELRQWKHGFYTLMHDEDMENQSFALDTLLFFNSAGWEENHGGYVSYIASGEDEELLTVHPKENCLALVFRDKETMKFVKHVNVGSINGATEFYDLSASYFEG